MSHQPLMDSRHPLDRKWRRNLRLIGHRPYSQYVLGHAYTRHTIFAYGEAVVSAYNVVSQRIGPAVFYVCCSNPPGSKAAPSVRYRIRVKLKKVEL